MTISCVQALWKNPTLLGSCNSILQSFRTVQLREVQSHLKCCRRRRRLSEKKRGLVVYANLLPVDPWAPDSQSVLASQLFAVSLFPYLGFLYFITKSKSAPKLTLFGFYFLLVFVGATIPAGIYAKLHYGTSLSNVDWLHGGAESLLTLTNLFIVLGLREGLRNARNAKESTSNVAPTVNDEKKPLA